MANELLLQNINHRRTTLLVHTKNGFEFFQRIRTHQIDFPAGFINFSMLWPFLFKNPTPMRNKIIIKLDENPRLGES